MFLCCKNFTVFFMGYGRNVKLWVKKNILLKKDQYVKNVYFNEFYLLPGLS
jgi:hypothetical protein